MALNARSAETLLALEAITFSRAQLEQEAKALPVRDPGDQFKAGIFQQFVTALEGNEWNAAELLAGLSTNRAFLEVTKGTEDDRPRFVYIALRDILTHQVTCEIADPHDRTVLDNGIRKRLTESCAGNPLIIHGIVMERVRQLLKESEVINIGAFIAFTKHDLIAKKLMDDVRIMNGGEIMDAEIFAREMIVRITRKNASKADTAVQRLMAALAMFLGKKKADRICNYEIAASQELIDSQTALAYAWLTTKLTGAAPDTTPPSSEGPAQK